MIFSPLSLSQAVIPTEITVKQGGGLVTGSGLNEGTAEVAVRMTAMDAAYRKALLCCAVYDKKGVMQDVRMTSVPLELDTGLDTVARAQIEIPAKCGLKSIYYRRSGADQAIWCTGRPQSVSVQGGNKFPERKENMIKAYDLLEEGKGILRLAPTWVPLVILPARQAD